MTPGSQLQANRAVLCDTGLLSRMLSDKPMFVTAYNQLLQQNITPVISSAVYIELQYWLIQERGRVDSSMTRSKFDHSRKWLDKTVVLHVAESDDLAIQTAKFFPNTGLGDSFTIAVSLFYDVEVFTLNPKHFARIKGLRLYEPDSYQQLLHNT